MMRRLGGEDLGLVKPVNFGVKTEDGWDLRNPNPDSTAVGSAN